VREAIAVIDRHIRRAGAEDVHYLVASGPQTAIGLRPVDDRALLKGEPVMISVAVESQRYWAETARTFVLGQASGELRAIHAVATEALKAMRTATRTGATTGNIAAAAEKSLGDAKLSQVAASYGFGHGIGLDAEELPIIRVGGKESVVRDATMALRAVLTSKTCGVAVAQTVVAGTDGSRPINDVASLIEL
jgi:Xaa-Pro aminopeptidase